MPGNPRLIRRVVNTWGLLDAVKLHVGHHHDDETLVRAAVFFVWFPSLVDELINEQSPVTIAEVHGVGYAGHWRRADIMAVLRLADGTYVEPRSIGECYGRQYASSPGES